MRSEQHKFSACGRKVMLKLRTLDKFKISATDELRRRNRMSSTGRASNIAARSERPAVVGEDTSRREASL
jgi:hypothetical protein